MQFFVDTDHPVAIDSPDHIVPAGTMRDNYSSKFFNIKLFGWAGKGKKINLLDIGCAGGKFVWTINNDGHIAVGIEGSDYSKNINRPFWDRCPNLFTADATKPFTVHTGDGEPYQFDCVTAWEFFEHIAEPDLSGVIDNIKRHLSQDGIIVCSISMMPSVRDGLEHHQTKKPREWWEGLFKKHGLVHDRELYSYFDNTWVRQGKHKFVLRRK